SVPANLAAAHMVGRGSSGLSNAIIRALPHDLHVVDVAFLQARPGDPDEARPRAHLVDGAVAGVAHGGAEAADQLVDDIAGRPLVGHLALDPLGHQLVRARDLLLEVAVGRAAGHGADAAHAAIALVAAALVEKDLSRCLV